MDTSVETSEIAARLISAVLCGGAIGWEREAHNKPAGLRTLMLVALGAASFTLITMVLIEQSPTLDPLRVVDGVVGGIGFLGAGVIIQSRGAVLGITTAAAIWVVGSLGVACGMGEYRIAFLVTAIGLVILHPFAYLEQLINRFSNRRQAAESTATDTSATAATKSDEA